MAETPICLHWLQRLEESGLWTPGSWIKHLPHNPVARGYAFKEVTFSATSWQNQLDYLTMVWHNVLCTLGVFNILILLYIFRTTVSRDRHGRKLRALAVPYTAVCAFRGFFPNNYITREVLVPHWCSSPGLGRFLACIAEVSFAHQMSLALAGVHADVYVLEESQPPAAGEARAAAGAAVIPRRSQLGSRGELTALEQVWGNGQARRDWPWKLAYFLTIVSISAQCNSNVSVATKNNMFGAIENSHWGLLSGTWAAWALYMLHRAPRAHALPTATKVFLRGTVMLGLAVCAFIAFVDVPMYVQRWRTEAPEDYHPLVAGVVDAFTQFKVERSFTVWAEEVAWMTGYFSLAVWGSLYIAANPPRVISAEAQAKLTKKE